MLQYKLVFFAIVCIYMQIAGYNYTDQHCSKSIHYRAHPVTTNNSKPVTFLCMHLSVIMVVYGSHGFSSDVLITTIVVI